MFQILAPFVVYFQQCHQCMEATDPPCTASPVRPMQCAQAAEVRRSYGTKSSQDVLVLAITDPICDPTATLVVESYHSQGYITMAAMFNVVKPQPIFKVLRDPLDRGKINFNDPRSI